jgi:predicted ATPase
LSETASLNFLTVLGWLRALAGGGALLIAVDNLQWADAASLDLLNFLAGHLAKRPAVIMATARPEFRRANPDYMLKATNDNYIEMMLGRLSEDASRGLLSNVLQYVENAPRQLVSYIVERAEGNPLLMEEFLRMLFDGGVFEPVGAGRWHTNLLMYATVSSTLPDGLVGVFQARLDDLPNEARRVLQIAAVFGALFWAGAVTHMAGYDLAPMLSELVGRSIIVQESGSMFAGETGYRFRHVLYREVAYSMLTRPDRELYHRRAAEWLTRHVSEREEYLSALGEHLVQGGQRETALGVYLVAAGSRLRRGMAAETLKLVEQGLAASRDLAREIALPSVSQLWMLQGEALLVLKRYGEASAAGQTALMLLDELPPDILPEARARAAQVLREAQAHLGGEDSSV